MGEELRFEVVTPMHLCGYDRKPLRRIAQETVSEGVRPGSVKGVVRWWMRVAVAGAYYRRFQKHIDISVADEIIADLAGSTKKPFETPFVIEQNVRYGLFQNPSCHRLQLINRRSFEVIVPGNTFKIVFKKELPDLLRWSLIASLTIDGLGRANRWGLGKCRLIDQNYNIDMIIENLKTAADDYVSTIRRKRDYDEQKMPVLDDNYFVYLDMCHKFANPGNIFSDVDRCCRGLTRMKTAFPCYFGSGGRRKYKSHVGITFMLNSDLKPIIYIFKAQFCRNKFKDVINYIKNNFICS